MITRRGDELGGVQMKNFKKEASERITVKLFIPNSPTELIEAEQNTDLMKDALEELEVKQFISISAETVVLAKHPG